MACADFVCRFKMPSLPFNLWPKRNPTASEPSTAVTAESAAPAASSEASSESLFDQVAKEEESSAAGTRKKQQSEVRLAFFFILALIRCALTAQILYSDVQTLAPQAEQAVSSDCRPAR
jgi:hypothetical protein